MSNDKFRFESEVDDAKPEPADVDLRMPLFLKRISSRRWVKDCGKHVNKISARYPYLDLVEYASPEPVGESHKTD